ncbi:MAG TPA: VOC family protein [Acidimicrobiales bacterium]|nr:VOC family protein [Acidimicrobiales bacterium]
MGRVVHFEIHADDPERAAAFYTGLFGWKAQRFGDQEYWLLSTGDGEGIDGAIVKRMGERPAPGHGIDAFVCTVHVVDCDAAVADAVDAGAEVALPAFDIPSVGRVAYLIDTEGNTFGVLSSDMAA